MMCLRPWKTGTATLAAMAISAGAIAPMIALSPVNAQINNQTSNRNYRIGQLRGFERGTTISSGARIPTTYEKEKILLVPGEKMEATLRVASNLVDRQGGTILIPRDSEIKGEFVPVTRNSIQGAQFVAKEIQLPNGERQNIDASSDIVTRTEKIKRGVKTGEVLRDAGYGAAAAAVIGLLTGNRKIEWSELLIGGGVGSIYRVIKGGKEADLISINTEEDLTLRLNSPLNVSPYR